MALKILIIIPYLPDVLKQITALAVCHDKAEASVVIEELLVWHNMGMPEET